jgi:exopolyphosphatase/guanosine-5'-triphosphate,3'-diphosphate pyrophosphatase
MRVSIDIGSNSLLLLVVDAEGRALHDEAVVVGLGRGLEAAGRFDPERRARAGEVLAGFAATARALGVPPERVNAVATSASRRAADAPAFYDEVASRTGLRVRVISGDEEARLTWEGAVGSVAPGETVLLCDPGGGSTEVAVGDASGVLYRKSLEIGTVRLTERFLGFGAVAPEALAELRAHVDAQVRSLALPAAPTRVVAVAGTVTTLAANELGLERYEAARVHGSSLSAAALAGWGQALAGSDPDARRALLRVSPERADTLLAGAEILSRVLASTGLSAWEVSDRGLRWALVTEEAR